MNNIHPGMFGVFGMLVGVFLYQLPCYFFYRHTIWLAEAAFLEEFPEKRWVTRAIYGLLPVGFLDFVLMMTATDMTRAINWFFFCPIFFCCVGTMPAIPELLAKASVLIPVGHGSKSPVLFAFSPNAARAGAFRVVMATLVIAVFLWCQ